MIPVVLLEGRLFLGVTTFLGDERVVGDCVSLRTSSSEEHSKECGSYLISPSSDGLRDAARCSFSLRLFPLFLFLDLFFVFLNSDEKSEKKPETDASLCLLIVQHGIPAIVDVLSLLTVVSFQAI